ncbi:MAG: flagellar biosynthesis protein FlhF [Spirochaetaceae bacterium]|jgi:flagellar biosynthesis protein FlhF|nr:flagellar biosynthesis protein FlhF [Spirochaetaceae bacterium]
MTETYTVQAATLAECRAITRRRYGDRAYIFDYKSVRSGGFLGLFVKENVIASVIVPAAKPDLSKYASGIIKKAPDLDNAAQAQQEKAKILSAAAEVRGLDPNLQAILTQVKLLNDKIDTKLSPAAARHGDSGEHETLVKIRDTLEQNDFSPAFRREIIEHIRKEFSIEALNDYTEVQQKVLEWIGGRIKIYDDTGPYKRPRIIVLVGPTGVGKTTTICKLAASFMYYPAKNAEKQNVSLITIDRYRIAADKQLGELAACLQADFMAVDDADELKKELALRADSFDTILVDTIGRSPRASVELAEMKNMLEVCGTNAEVYLTFAAATKSSGIIEIMRQFEPFNYKAVIITKLDETRQLGNVISALAEQGKPLAYITDGQSTTPYYIHKANIVQLLTNLEGFTLDRDRLEAHFTYGA